MPVIKFHPFTDVTSDFAEAPKPAAKHMPEWYREQPGQAPGKTNLDAGVVASTIKKCMPVFDVTTAGYILAAPCDIYVNSTDPNKLVYSIPEHIRQFKGDLFSTHSPEQYSEYPIDLNRYHKDLLRVQPFWSVGTPEGYSTIFANPFHRPSPLFAFSAIIDTDAFISEGHLSFLVEKNFDGIIKQGTPLVQIIPFKRDEWTSEVLTEAQALPILKKQRVSLRSVFSNAYKNKFRSKKEYK